MSVANLRFLNETSGLLLETCNPDQVKIDLSKEFSLNEAYFGKDPMKDIQAAMSECLRIIKIDRMMDITLYPCNKALEKACKDAFGFKRVHIIWNDSVYFNGSICTVVGSRIVPYTKAAALRLFGKKTIVESPIGYYNKQHDLICYICLDSHSFVDKCLTDEECVAVLLHEIGHNFDYTLGSFLTQFTQIFATLNQVIVNPDLNGASQFTKNVMIIQALQNLAPFKGLIAWITHIDTWLTSKIPELGEIIRILGDAYHKVVALLTAAFLPRALVKTASAIAASPAFLLNAGIVGLNSIMIKHGEYYADSFSASYGYGPQLVTALEKIMDKTSDLRVDMPVLNAFWSLAEIEQELTNALYVPVLAPTMRVSGDHGSNQQRLKSLMNKLQSELKDPHVTPEMKKDIQRELDDMYTIYNECIMKPNSKAVEIFRKFMDLYMNGRDKIPLLSKIVQKNRA